MTGGRYGDSALNRPRTPSNNCPLHQRRWLPNRSNPPVGGKMWNVRTGRLEVLDITTFTALRCPDPTLHLLLLTRVPAVILHMLLRLRDICRIIQQRSPHAQHRPSLQSAPIDSCLGSALRRRPTVVCRTIAPPIWNHRERTLHPLQGGKLTPRFVVAQVNS